MPLVKGILGGRPPKGLAYDVSQIASGIQKRIMLNTIPNTNPLNGFIGNPFASCVKK